MLLVAQIVTRIMHVLFLSSLIFLTRDHTLVEASTQSTDSKKQVIVVSLPGESDVQYLDNLQFIADFVIEMDGKTKGRDYLFIVHDESGLKYLKNHKFTNARLIQVKQSLDMWMRDFPPTMPKQQVKFKYRPQYISTEQAKFDEGNFEKFASVVGLPQLRRSDLVLEGGNIVDNGVDIAITTARTYDDNPTMSHQEFVNKLETAIQRKVAVLPDPEDTTGHADGVVTFVENNTLLISLFDDADGPSFYDAMETAVLDVFPNLTVVPLPCYAKKGKTQGFVSAEGSYANSLVTNNAVYLPFFANQTSNDIAFAAFKNNTNKDIIPVYNAGKVPVLGGSLRCMTWQIDQEHPVAKALFAYVDRSPSSGSSVKVVVTVFFLQVSLA